jgi:hypothetical protein
LRSGLLGVFGSAFALSCGSVLLAGLLLIA